VSAKEKKRSGEVESKWTCIVESQRERGGEGEQLLSDNNIISNNLCCLKRARETLMKGNTGRVRGWGIPYISLSFTAPALAPSLSLSH